MFCVNQETRSQLLRAGLILRSIQTHHAELFSLLSQTSSQVQQLASRFDNFSSGTVAAPHGSQATAGSTHCYGTSEWRIEDATQGRNQLLSANDVTSPPPLKAEQFGFAHQTSAIYSTTSNVSFLVHRNAKGNVLCTCQCHQRTFYRAQRTRAGFLGSLYVGYSGLPILSGPCDIAACSRRCGKYMNLKYIFPSWFIQWAVYVSFVQSAIGAPTFGIAISQRSTVTETSIFAIARRSDNHTLCQVLEEQSSLSGEIDTSGRNPLFWAIQSGSIETVQILLRFGADAHALDDSGISPSVYAYSVSLAGHLDPQFEEELEKLFPRSQSERVLEFPYLHNVVCRILPLDLHTQLKNPRHLSQIDSTDKKGNTALYWAATRGDHESVTHLLLAGAALDMCNLNRYYPLIASARASTPRCLERLLAAGADANAGTCYGFTALHAVAQFQEDSAYLQPLLVAGANINCVTKRNFTPLMVAVFERHPRMCDYLIQNGADLNISNLVGIPPLFEAIRRHSHACLELLLGAGADYTVVDNEGSTILHHAARYGNIKTLELLMDAELKNLNPEVRDCAGQTALDLMSVQDVKDITQAFSALQDSIVEADTVFVNALEVQEIDE